MLWVAIDRGKGDNWLLLVMYNFFTTASYTDERSPPPFFFLLPLKKVSVCQTSAPFLCHSVNYGTGHAIAWYVVFIVR
jgi:hypothetical protein